MVITGVLVVEGPVDVDKLEETISGRLLLIPRFRQRVEIRSGEYWWVEVTDLDRKRHIKRARLPERRQNRASSLRFRPRFRANGEVPPALAGIRKSSNVLERRRSHPKDPSCDR